MSRAERRRDRAARKRRDLGDGTALTATGFIQDMTKKRGRLPPKVPGAHRIVVTVAYTMTPALAVRWLQRDDSVIMDLENMFEVGVGCWDCHEPLDVRNPSLLHTSCPADGEAQQEGPR